jgi:putative flippase GtrA
MSESPSGGQFLLAGMQERFPWVGQFLRFGGVGVLATLVHVSAYVVFVEKVGTTPIVANLLAFGLAVMVSFAGHAGWTFRAEFGRSGRSVHVLFARFAISALLGLLLNSIFVLVLVTWWGLAYGWAIPFFVFVTPVVLYLTNRMWVFAD